MNVDVTRDCFTNRKGAYWRIDRSTLDVEVWAHPAIGWSPSNLTPMMLSDLFEMGEIAQTTETP